MMMLRELETDREGESEKREVEISLLPFSFFRNYELAVVNHFKTSNVAGFSLSDASASAPLKH